MIVLLFARSLLRWLRFGVMILLAALAGGCHLVPGSILYDGPRKVLVYQDLAVLVR